MNAATEMQAKIDAAMAGHWLYDPPVDGKTPLDGNGEPRKSHIMGDITKKLMQGFTIEAVGVEGPAVPEEVPEKLERTGTNQEALKANITRADTSARGKAEQKVNRAKL